jgi:hypothetical protein
VPLRNQAFFAWCFVVTPGACSKTDQTLPALGFFGAVFFGFLGSRPDRFCPFAIVTSNHDYRWTMMRSSHIKWLVFGPLNASGCHLSFHRMRSLVTALQLRNRHHLVAACP